MIELRTNRPPNGNFAINRASKQARGLVGWWPLAGDIHEYAYNYPIATRYGNVSLGTTAQGRVGVFPGNTGDYINTNKTRPSESYMTVAIWLSTNTLAGGAYNLRYAIANEGYDSGWMIRLDTSDDKLYWYVYSGAYRNATSTITLTTDRWYHVAGVYNVSESSGSQLKLYIDGQYNAQGTSGGAAIAVSANAIGIGASPGSTDRIWSGYLRDARVYNRALSAIEIYQLWAPNTRYELFRSPYVFKRYDSSTPATTTIRLTWSDVVEHEDGFSIERDTDGGGFAVVHTTAAGVETWDDVLLPTGHTYTYRVRSTSAALGNSEYSNTSAITV